MEQKHKSIPQLLSRVTLSMVLTSSLILNNGYALATDVQTDTTADSQPSASERRKTTTTKAVTRAEKTDKVESQATTETSIYDFEYKLSDNDDVIITKYTGSDTEVIIPEDFNGYAVTEIANGAFRSSAVTSVTLPSSVEKIENYAFYSCRNLATVNFNDGLKEIGTEAFAYCYALKSVSIPESCKKIGEEAFYYDNALETLDLGKGVETIGGSAFRYCSKLSALVIPDSVTAMGGYVFDGCSSLADITIGKGITDLPAGAFGSNTALISITLPDNIKTLGNYAFGSCRNLTEINWSANLTTIGNYAFEYNYALKEVSVPDTVTKLGTEAFRYCTALESLHLGKSLETEFVNIVTGDTVLKTITVHKDNPYLSNDSNGILFNKDKTKLIRMGRGYEGEYTIPSTVKTIGTYAFSYCQKLNKITVGKNIEKVESYAFQYCNQLTEIALPASVKEIEREAFRNCTGLNTITLGKSLENVGDYAFYGCNKLTAITLPDTCQTIGQYAFQGCSALSDVNLGKGLVTIKYEAFWNCSSLKTVTLPESLKTIETYAFEYTGLESICIPDSVETMGSNVFQGCGALASVTLGKGMTVVPNSTFNGCQALKKVEIPANIKEIYNYAFNNCTALESVVFKEGLTRIRENAFNNCTSLTAVTLPESLVTVDGNAFNGCKALESFYVGKGVTSLPVSVFYGNNALKTITVSEDNENFKSVDGVLFNKACTEILVFPRAKEGKYVIPDTVEKINNNAFDNATAITEVTIGSAVKTIGNNAFVSCKALTKIKINDNCESIGESAFKGCTALQSVTLGKNTKTLGNYCFYNCSSLSEIVWGEALEAIPYACFENCNALESVTIPQGVTVIEQNGFHACAKLESVTIADSVKTIGNYAFEYCRTLKTVDLGNGLERIKYEAFYQTALEEVTFPDSLSNVEDYIFAYVPLKKLHIGKGLQSFKVERLLSDSLEVVTISEENENYTAVDNVIYDKEMTKLLFCPRNKEGEFIIPGTVTSLGTYAFYNCKSLTSIKEYGSVLSMDNYAVDNLDKSKFTGYVIENSYLHKAFVDRGYSCETIEDTRTQIGDCEIIYDRYVQYTYQARANVKVYDNGKELTENKDYKVYYSNGSYHTGDATITVYGMGEYGGNTSVTFTIYYALGNTFDVKRTGAGTYTFKNTASNGVPDYTYTFAYTEKEKVNAEDADWRTIPNPDNLSTLSYFFEEDGNFTVRATVTDKAGNQVYKQQDVEVTAPRAKITVSNEKPRFGDTVTITGYGTNFGKNKQYQFAYKEENADTWQMIQDFSTERETTFTFNRAGTCQIRVAIKDDAENTAEKIQSFTIIQPELEVTTSKAPVLNEEFNIVANIKNVGNDYSYQYQYRKSGETNWTTIKKFASVTQYPLTFAETGTYQLRVIARYNKDTSLKFTKVKTVTVKKPVVTLTAPETADLGAEKTLKATANYFGNGTTYKYQYKSVSDTTWRNLYSGENTTANMTFSQSGNYTVRVIATDNAGNRSISTKTVAVTGAIVQLVADNPNVYVGEDIHLTAAFKNLKGDTSDYTYQFAYRECLSSTWHTLQDYSSENTAKFTTKQCATSDQYAAYAGMYELKVTAKDKNGVTSVANINVLVKKMELTYFLSETDVVPNTEVTLNAYINGGAKPVKFMYEFQKDNGAWQPLVYSGYTENTVLKFKFSAEGTYHIRASAQDNNGLTIGNTTGTGGVGYEGKIITLYVRYPVVHTLEGSIYSSTNSLSIGQECTFTASSNYATGTPKYKFTVKSSFDNTEKVLRDYSTDSRITFAGDKEGTYTVTAYITDDTGITVKVQKSVTVWDYVLNISSDRSEVTSGKEVRITAKISYGAEDTYTYKYEYRLKGDSKWKTASSFSENTVQACKFYTEGVYDVRVTARNSAGAEKSAVLSVAVNPKPTCVISAMPDHIAVDTDTILICNSTGGTGTKTYRYEYCLTGTGQWTEFYNGGAITLFSADKAGVYKIRATVTDSTGATKRTDYIQVYVQ